VESAYHAQAKKSSREFSNSPICIKASADLVKGRDRCHVCPATFVTRRCMVELRIRTIQPKEFAVDRHRPARHRRQARAAPPLLGDRRLARGRHHYDDRLPPDVGPLVLARPARRGALGRFLEILAALHRRLVSAAGRRVDDARLSPRTGASRPGRQPLPQVFLARSQDFWPGHDHHRRRDCRRRGLRGFRHPPPDRLRHDGELSAAALQVVEPGAVGASSRRSASGSRRCTGTAPCG
jgi:hypothetical protein